MSGRILIIDPVATNRIVLKVKLLTAQYNVFPCATLQDAYRIISTTPIDLIVAEMAMLTESFHDFYAQITQFSDGLQIPLIGIGHFDSAERRLAALRMGASEVMNKPLSDSFLMARIRSLLRARNTEAELRLRDDTSRALGFAESAAAYSLPARVALVAPPTGRSVALARTLTAALNVEVRVTPVEAILSRDARSAPDLCILDFRTVALTGEEGRLFQLISELRSRSDTRHAAQLVLAPSKGSLMAAMVLDLGADEVVPDFATGSEIAIRASNLLVHRARQQRLRDTLHHGVHAAITDALTGLYNRRYALSYLQNLADRDPQDAQDFALMVLDIDHFKRINDTWGHSNGDKVLASVAKTLQGHIRAVDLLARIGGEEFLIAMPETSEVEARQAAERLRDIIQSHPVEIDSCGTRVPVTLSIGVAMGGRTNSIEATIECADAALYSSKSAGRNTVTFSVPAA